MEAKTATKGEHVEHQKEGEAKATKPEEESSGPVGEAPSCCELRGDNQKDSELLGFTLEKTLTELEKEEWYHGCLPLEDIVGLLEHEGDFLIRGPDAQEENDGASNTVAWITVKCGDDVQDFPVRYKIVNKEHIFSIDGTNKKANIMELIKFHQSSATPVKDKVILKTPIPKQQWELRSDKIKLNEKIGAGAFGEVWLGTLEENPDDPPLQVAIKLKKVNKENQAKLDEMYREARLMRQYRHKNVVRFYGVVLKSADSAMIVMEYVDGGALNDYLKKNTNVNVKTRISYAIDAATGLAYLHAKSCMHRDVACRNCLIDVSKGIVKLTDFGLSKQAESYTIPKDEKLPIRWQAPEVIATRVYTLKSDVYSYGVLLWEIFNNGEAPYKGMDNKAVRENILDPKFRPPTDDSLPIVVSKVMLTCWRADPAKRPTMARIVQYLSNARPEQLLPRSELAKRSSSGSRDAPSVSRESQKRLRSRGGEMLAKGVNIIRHPADMVRQRPSSASASKQRSRKSQDGRSPKK
ncbi:hypothetical protein V3C99_006230 [Haemonchus contortus]|uniref:Tyrosine-protein kinase n=1 Tax=Haemonchus contortus TaxID=6289 RepID=A0A7I4XTW3_HAECO